MSFWKPLFKRPKNTNSVTLKPLTPEYNKENHGSYVEKINAALKEPKLRNIALSGNYGVGKSSILQEVTNQHKKHIVEISLSTLAPMNDSGHDGSTPEDKNVHPPKQETTTNRIQQEIVKQLLYSIKPHKAPHSRFQRIERFNLWREIGVALLTSVFTVIGFALTGWTDKLAKIVQPMIELGMWIHCAVFVLGGLLVFGARLLVHGRIHISKFSAGAATVTLDAKSTSYFDQYLDEIVYFFEVSPKTIVVFEDIDRFDDSHIFETLRALNTLLNAAPQIKEPVRFIYAIKDSIFDPKVLNSTKTESEEEIKRPEEAEIQRANRTKFFDLIIPVVPFITHRSARDLVVQVLGEADQEEIDDELIKLAARYVPDMRLLKSIYNEFIVFREKLFQKNKDSLNLNDSELYAMMLYKSTHLSDFELIRLGKSKLDDLYRISRDLVSKNISNIEQKIRNDQSNQTKILANYIERRSEDLGKQMIEHLHRTARSLDASINEQKIRLGSSTISTNYLKTREFWESFISSESPLLECATDQRDTTTYYSSYIKLNFKYSDLPKEFADVNINDWTQMEKKDFQASIDKTKNQLNVLRSAHMKDLIELPDALIEYKDLNQSFDAITRDMFSHGLAYQLLRSGYLNDNFTLYTSLFHKDTVSAAATNFIIHNVKRNIMDEHLALTDSDIQSIIKESGKSALSDPCLYNISILNYLLKHDPAKTDVMVQSLIQFGDEELRFLQAYLNGENEHIELIKKLSLKTEEILNFLINQMELNDELRLTLVNTTLEHLESGLEYNLDSEISEYLKDNHFELSVLSSSIDKDQAENIAKLYANAVIRVPELKHLSEQIHNAFITKDLYDINVDNLKIVLGNETDLALDVALEKNKGIYTYLLLNLGEYVKAVINTSKTISSNEYFIRIVEDVLALKNTRDLDNVVMHASGDCIIEDLQQVEKDTWQCLAEFNRFTPTFDNISHYRSTVGEIDEYIEKVLIESDAITEYELATEDEKEKLAVYILHANGDFLTSEHIVQLVDSLNLTDYIHASRLPVEKGELFPLLLKGKIIEDCADTYEHLIETDWSIRESYIEASNEFKNYITPELLQGDLAAFLTSGKIGLDIKVSIVERAEEFTVDCSKNDLIELAQFAINQDKKLPIDVIEKMASNGIEDKSIILMLAHHLETIDSNQLLPILEMLKGDYPKLTLKGRERPKIPTTPTPETENLLNTLKKLGIVTKFTLEDGYFRVNKKHK